METEKMFEEILRMAGYEDVSASYDPAILIKMAREIRPGRVENVETKRREAGKSTRWNVLSSRKVLDWVYGLDIVIAPGGLQSETRFGFDATLNPAEVAKKLQKLETFRPLWQAIGITKVAVVLLAPSSSEWGVALLSNQEKERLGDMALDYVIFPMDEQTALVQSHVLAF